MNKNEINAAVENLVLLLSSQYPYAKAGRSGHEHFVDYQQRFIVGLSEQEIESILLGVCNQESFDCWSINDFVRLADIYLPKFRFNVSSYVSKGLLTKNVGLLKARERR